MVTPTLVDDRIQVSQAPSIIFPPQDTEFGNADYLVSFDLDQIIVDLIKKNPQQFGHLASFEILSVWRKKGGKSKGRAIMGACIKPSGLVTAYTAADYIVSVSADHVREYQLQGRELESVVFEQLCKAGVDEKGNPILWDYDFQGFASQVREYGLINQDLRLAATAFSQVKLDI